jgi:hypothetical protein
VISSNIGISSRDRISKRAGKQICNLPPVSKPDTSQSQMTQNRHVTPEDRMAHQAIHFSSKKIKP